MKKMIPLIIAIFSSFLAILAAWYQYQEKEGEKIEKNIQKGKADNFQTELIKKTQSLDLANNEIKRLQGELIEKTTQLLNESKSVQKIQDESIKFMTGEGTPTIEFGIKADGSYFPVLYNKTQYPMYDIRLQIDDFDKIINCRTKIVGDAFVIDNECIAKNSTAFGTFFLAPGQAQSFEYSIPRSQNFRHFRIQVITRKRIYNYFCILYHPTGSEYIRYRIRIYLSTKDYRLSQIDEKEQGLTKFDEKYWIEHFHVDKKILTGPIDVKPN